MCSISYYFSVLGLLIKFLAPNIQEPFINRKSTEMNEIHPYKIFLSIYMPNHLEGKKGGHCIIIR